MTPHENSFDPLVYTQVLAALLAGLTGPEQPAIIGADLPLPGGQAGVINMPSHELAEEILRTQYHAFYSLIHAYQRRAERTGLARRPEVAAFIMAAMWWIIFERGRPRVLPEAVARIWNRGVPALQQRVIAAAPVVDPRAVYGEIALETALKRFERALGRYDVVVPDDFVAILQRRENEVTAWGRRAQSAFRHALVRDCGLRADWKALWPKPALVAGARVGAERP
ncbi:MAG TPA: hypothetical protein VGG92_08225 [Caulobacteraceae bacterium]|jgi:hypothetical protein